MVPVPAQMALGEVAVAGPSVDCQHSALVAAAVVLVVHPAHWELEVALVGEVARPWTASAEAAAEQAAPQEAHWSRSVLEQRLEGWQPEAEEETLAWRLCSLPCYSSV